MSLPLLRENQKCCVASVLEKGHRAFSCSNLLVHHFDSISDPYLIVKPVIYLAICQMCAGSRFPSVRRNLTRRLMFKLIPF